MTPWIIIALIGAVIVFLLDFALRRKKWNMNTVKEKISLVIHMIFVTLYAFSSVLGIFLGIVGASPDTIFGQKLYDITLLMASYIWVVAIISTIASFILRKKGKTKASILINIFTLAYILIVFVVNHLAGLI